jgi:NitT/TauT family transport system permease protein
MRRRQFLRVIQIALLAAIFAAWHLLTAPGLLPNFVFENDDKAAFFFGEPLRIFKAIWIWFTVGEIYPHLWVTLQETALAFVIGTVSGLGVGLWLGLSPIASAIADPYIKAANALRWFFSSFFSTSTKASKKSRPWC